MKSARTARSSPCSISKPKRDRLNREKKTAELNGGGLFCPLFRILPKRMTARLLGKITGREKGKPFARKPILKKKKLFLKKVLTKKKR